MDQASFASRWLLPGLLVASTAAVGCSINDFTEGMFSGGQTPSGEGGSGGATSSGTVDPTTTSTTMSGTPTTTSAGGEGGMGGAGGAGTTTTTTTTTTTSGGGTLGCGDETCTQGGDNACCWNNQGQGEGACIDGPADPATCDTSMGFNGRRTRIECQLPSHCPGGMVCCATRVSLGGGSGYYSQAVCTAADECEPSDANGALYTLCDTANPDCPNARPNCGASSLLPDGYTICRGN